MRTLPWFYMPNGFSWTCFLLFLFFKLNFDLISKCYMWTTYLEMMRFHCNHMLRRYFNWKNITECFRMLNMVFWSNYLTNIPAWTDTASLEILDMVVKCCCNALLLQLMKCSRLNDKYRTTSVHMEKNKKITTF